METSYEPLDDVIDELRQHIETLVAAGFLDEDEIELGAAEAFEDRLEPATLRAAAHQLTAAAWEAHARAQATWPAVTDCDRLDAAFAEMEARGIVARQDSAAATTAARRRSGPRWTMRCAPDAPSTAAPSTTSKTPGARWKAAACTWAIRPWRRATRRWPPWLARSWMCCARTGLRPNGMAPHRDASTSRSTGSAGGHS
jgi:hypothetical protein